MSFQTIYRMLTEGTELGIHVKRVENRLCVAVMPKRENLKNESGQSIIPLVLNGTPEELDAEFLSAIARPIEKVQGILMNLEAFEKQAEKAAAESKAAQSAAKKETKEERERRDKNPLQTHRSLQGILNFSIVNQSDGFSSSSFSPLVARAFSIAFCLSIIALVWSMNVA